jgi:hypothetical protein
VDVDVVAAGVGSVVVGTASVEVAADAAVLAGPFGAVVVASPTDRYVVEVPALAARRTVNEPPKSGSLERARAPAPYQAPTNGTNASSAAETTCFVLTRSLCRELIDRA